MSFRPPLFKYAFMQKNRKLKKNFSFNRQFKQEIDVIGCQCSESCGIQAFSKRKDRKLGFRKHGEFKVASFMPRFYTFVEFLSFFIIKLVKLTFCDFFGSPNTFLNSKIEKLQIQDGGSNMADLFFG